jgi:hypothetical protein
MAFDPFSAAFDLINTGLQKWIPDANVRENAARDMASQLNLQVIGQIEINKEEAKSNSLFVAGWRPFIGWVCGGAYAYSFVIQPFLIFAAAVCGISVDHAKLPHLDWSELGFVLAGILGLGYMRMNEKKLGVA